MTDAAQTWAALIINYHLTPEVAWSLTQAELAILDHYAKENQP